MRNILTGVAAVALAAAIPAIAQTANTSAQADAHWNHHGQMMNKTVLRTDVAAHVAKMFAHFDTNKDGFITQDEASAAKAMRHGMRGDSDEKRGEMAEHHGRFDSAQMMARFDTNKDGQLTKAEVDAAMAARAQATGRPVRGSDRLFARVDSNHDGVITAAEIDAAKQQMAANPRHEGMMRHAGMGMFKRADLNQDGKVTLAEAQQAALAHFDQLDTNRDGKVTPEERKAAWAQHKGMHQS